MDPAFLADLSSHADFFVKSLISCAVNIVCYLIRGTYSCPNFPSTATRSTPAAPEPHSMRNFISSNFDLASFGAVLPVVLSIEHGVCLETHTSCIKATWLGQNCASHRRCCSAPCRGIRLDNSIQTGRAEGSDHRRSIRHRRFDGKEICQAWSVASLVGFAAI